MAHHLGYDRDFTKADFERVYNSVALQRHYQILFEQQRQTFETLFPQQALAPTQNAKR